MVAEQLKRRWDDALVLPGKANLIESNVSEVAEYYNLSASEARLYCETGEQDSKREWEAKSRSRPEDIVNFYDTTRSYIFEHMWWHAVDPWPAANVAILDYAIRRNMYSYLDFGSGVGANGILYAKHGFEVTLADVSRTMLDFARWRLERRGLKATYVYLREEPPPRSRFDLATAVDVIEHVVNPRQELKRLAGALKPGGALVFNCLTGVDPDKPMHIIHSSYDVYRGVRAAGFRAEHSPDAEALKEFGLEVLKRGTQSRLDDLLCGLYDRYRYSGAADIYWAVKQTILRRNP
jgi:2-polyprenyl-3-methyl-5-hydroxy-6-metoxy-1,4-benzoquinol methylase